MRLTVTPRRRAALAALVLTTFSCTSGQSTLAPPLVGDLAAVPPTEIRTIETTAATTTRPTPRQPTLEPRGDPAGRVVGYYAGWERETLSPAALPTGLLTHVIYAFATVTTDSRCLLTEGDAERGVIAELQAWKRRAGAKTLLAVGGWEQSRHFSAAASTQSGRRALAAACVRLARDLGFDGIDLDWEYPSGGKWSGRLADPANHVALLAEVRALQRPGELLTVATPASPGTLETFGLSAIEPHVD
jgi:chitinase